MSYRDNISPIRTMRGWKQMNFSGELRVIGVVANRFQGKEMMTSPVLGIDNQPIRIRDQIDLLDDGMIIRTLSGSRYLLNGKDSQS